MGSKTDVGILKFLDRTPIKYEVAREKYKVIKKIPFSSARKRMSTILEKSPGTNIFLLKGASELIVDSCDKVHFKSGEKVPLD